MRYTTEAADRRAAERSNIIVTSGGVSVAVTIHQARLKELGAEIFFSASRCVRASDRVCATAKRHAGFWFAGNPVSVSVTSFVRASGNTDNAKRGRNGLEQEKQLSTEA